MKSLLATGPRQWLLLSTTVVICLVFSGCAFLNPNRQFWVYGGSPTAQVRLVFDTPEVRRILADEDAREEDLNRFWREKHTQEDGKREFGIWRCILSNILQADQSSWQPWRTCLGSMCRESRIARSFRIRNPGAAAALCIQFSIRLSELPPDLRVGKKAGYADPPTCSLDVGRPSRTDRAVSPISRRQPGIGPSVARQLSDRVVVLNGRTFLVLDRGRTSRRGIQFISPT